MCDYKICGNCKEELPATEEYFSLKQLKTKTIFQWQCRKCQKEYRKLHYENNKAKYIEKAKKYREKSVEEFTEFKKTLKCSKCGENRWWVLDFHHINPNEKDRELSNLIRAASKEKIKKELDKCIVLCSNCHRDLHYKEKQAGLVKGLSRDTSNV